ncbi:MAG TPA: type II toxin-antitoxin system VapC family toxin [Thermoanaerobaculia bacterium]|nr:type II toxin-antitoxin system VapC family toxin [Thermoanaerobaculia bacterium]
MLDTHAWIWWVASPEQISQAARARISLEVEAAGIHVSAISCWEISLLVRKGRLALTLDVADWIAKMEALPFVHFVPIDNRIALRSNSLPGDFHDDPADRLIVATALTLGATLITKDARIHAYPHAETLW